MAYLLEHWKETRGKARTGTAPLEPPDIDQQVSTSTGAPTSTTPGTRSRKGLSKTTQNDRVPEFHGIRTARYTFVEYVTGERELYDDVRDPDQLHNLAATADRHLLSELHDRVSELVMCRAASCREAENAPL
jgi:hypothetical protein